MLLTFTPRGCILVPAGYTAAQSDTIQRRFEACGCVCETMTLGAWGTSSLFVAREGLRGLVGIGQSARLVKELDALQWTTGDAVAIGPRVHATVLDAVRRAMPAMFPGTWAHRILALRDSKATWCPRATPMVAVALGARRTLCWRWHYRDADHNRTTRVVLEDGDICVAFTALASNQEECWEE